MNCLSCTHCSPQASLNQPHISPPNPLNLPEDYPIFFKCSSSLILCRKCSLIHLQQGTGRDESSYSVKIVCQECEDNEASHYCESCDQHQCFTCLQRIHNKGKRAKHPLENISQFACRVQSFVYIGTETLKLLSDGVNYIGGKNRDISETLETIQKLEGFLTHQIFLQIDRALILVDKHFLPEDRLPSSIEEVFYRSCSLKELTNQYFLSLIHRFPFASQVCLINTNQISKLHSIIQSIFDANTSPLKIRLLGDFRTNEIEAAERMSSDHFFHQKQASNFSAVSSVDSFSLRSVNEDVKSIGGKQQCLFIQSSQQVSQSSRRESSQSTQNSTRRHCKAQIPYFEPFKIHQQNASVYEAELKIRELAETGILMIRKEKVQGILGFNDLSSICRVFTRTIGEREIQYVAYRIDTISVENLSWVIESIKQDRMCPNEKLIQCRLKECFDIKVNTKAVENILKYLSSEAYIYDIKVNNAFRRLPKMQVSSRDSIRLITFAQQAWDYEDQMPLREEEYEWVQLQDLLKHYFKAHSQIYGGRYGCVQFIKLNGPMPLKMCSLGKLSMYVQEAVNRGIVRYHKTLLIPHNAKQTSEMPQLQSENIFWNQLQQDIKIALLQTSLIDLFLETGQKIPISLAQIPLNLKKNLIFDINLPELGFPKLKYLLDTLTDKLKLEMTKTHVTFELENHSSGCVQQLRCWLAEQADKLLTRVLNTIRGILRVKYELGALYEMLNYTLRFTFDFKIYKFPDFYQFLVFYGSSMFDICYISGIFHVSLKQKLASEQSYETLSLQSPHSGLDSGVSESPNKSIEQIVNNILEDDQVWDCDSKQIDRKGRVELRVPLSFNSDAYQLVDIRTEEKKSMHSRVRSTNETQQTKHQRIYSTFANRKDSE